MTSKMLGRGSLFRGFGNFLFLTGASDPSLTVLMVYLGGILAQKLQNVDQNVEKNTKKKTWVLSFGKLSKT